MGEAVFRAGVNGFRRLGADADDFAARVGRFAVSLSAWPKAALARGAPPGLARFCAGLAENRISLCGPMF